MGESSDFGTKICIYSKKFFGMRLGETAALRNLSFLDSQNQLTTFILFYFICIHVIIVNNNKVIIK